MNSEELGKRIKEARLAKKMTQSELVGTFITSRVPSSMLITGISCTHFTVTIVSIAIITAKASNAGTQQIILNGFGSL